MYDGQKLFCPAHPGHPLEQVEIATANEPATIEFFCIAITTHKINETPLACMNSAHWESIRAMNADLLTLLDLRQADYAGEPNC